MKLTTQMQAEVETIRTRIDFISKEVWIPMENGLMSRDAKCQFIKDTAHATVAELNPYKVRLENILCETDIKEEAHLYESSNNQSFSTLTKPLLRRSLFINEFYKREQLEVLKQLLMIEVFLGKCQVLLVDDDSGLDRGDPLFSDDNERYLEMAIRLDPNDREVLYRK